MSRWVIVLGVGLALVATACPSKPATTGTPSATDTPAAATAAPAATAAAATAAPAAPAATATVSPDNALIDLLRTGKAAAYKVTYNMATTGSGSSTTATYSQAYKPPYFRTDFTDTGTNEKVTILVRPEGTYFCGSIGGPSPACFSLPSGQSGGIAQLPAAPQPIPQDLAGWGLTPSGTRTIAGQTARCFSFKGPAGATGGSVETTGCYTAEGVPLLMSTKGAGVEVTMTATAFSTNISDADFAVPFPVQKLPGAP